jgi:G3E family GTPase
MTTESIASLLTERFGFNNGPSLSGEEPRYERIHLNRPEFRITALVFGLLKHIGCEAEQTVEKMAWMFSFTVAGSKCFVSSEKFGPRLYVPSQLSEKRKRSIQGMLIVGLQHYSNLLQHQIDSDLVGLNDFGIINQTSFLRRGYELFRAKADEAYTLDKHKGERRESQNNSSFSITFTQEPWWYSFSATVAYFSYLEHLYSGLYAFSGKRHTVLELQHFMTLSWRKKHERLLKEAGAFDANQYKRLLDIFQQQRNLFSHGLGGFKANSIYRFIPDVGFVPSSLSKEIVQPNLMFSDKHQEVFQANCREFDAFDQALGLSSLSHGIEWAKSGLNFRFDTQFMDELYSALDKGEFSKFLEWQSYLFDKAANFE